MESCSITSPNIIRVNWLILGWHTSLGTHWDWGFNTSKTLYTNQIWFAITHSGEFEFTGIMQSIMLPNGTYQLETWGANGGNGIINGLGGLGGYSAGIYSISESSQKLFIVVGERGADATSLDGGKGGWNGGGTGRRTSMTASGGGGGGASHIARISGTLESLIDKQTLVLIVAGGGGGGSYSSCGGHGEIGGDGGGLVGGSSTGCNSGLGGKGGTQISGGEGNVIGVFGRGADALTSDGGGAGGGWYGGGTASSFPGGGGSGYIDGVTSGNTFTGLEKNGNGHARITKID